MVAELYRLSSFDPEHLPLEIELIEATRCVAFERAARQQATNDVVEQMP